MQKYRVPTLTIATSDSSGGAGIQADLKAFSALGTYGMSVIVAITAQNTEGVYGIEALSTDIIEKQMDAVFTDIFPKAVKIGMVYSSDIILQVAEGLKKYKPEYVVLDPVMISKSNCLLLKQDAMENLIKNLIPLSYILTPNVPEAEEITGIKIENIEDMKKAGEKILEMGAKNVLIKGGHLEGDATDVLMGKDLLEVYGGKRYDRKNTHGTGCTLSSSIASYLALGYDIKEAIRLSKIYISEAIEHSFDIGKGVGPVHHFYKFE
jgi:hydroxymethylpyrimidine/phosphomethylpyrimidine kinase